MVNFIKKSKIVKILLLIIAVMVVAFVFTIPMCNSSDLHKQSIGKSDFVTSVSKTESKEFKLAKGIYKIKLNYESLGIDPKAKVEFINPTNRKINDVEKTIVPSYSKSVDIRVYSGTDNQKAKIVIEGTSQSNKIKSAKITFLKNKTRAYNMAKYSLYIILLLFAFWFIGTGFRKFFKYENKNIVLGLCFVTVLILLPIITKTLPTGHDLEFHLLRLVGIDEGFMMGQLPVRIQPNWQNGYGAAVGVTYPNIPLLVPAFLWRIGFPLMTAYKSYLVVSAIMMVIVAFFSFNRISKDKNAALFATVLYSLAPYHFTNMYTRHAVGENFAMIFLPLIVLGFYELLIDKKSNNDVSVWLLLGFTGVIVSHPLSVFMVAIFCVVTCIVFVSKLFDRDTVKSLLLTAVLTIGANAWVIVPMLDYYKNETLGVKSNNIYHINESGVPLKELLLGKSDVFNRTPGIALTIVFFLGLFVIFNLDLNNKKRKTIISLEIIAFISLFMASEFFPYSFIKENMKGVYGILSNLQFAMRFLGIASVILATIFVAILMLYKNDKKKYFITSFVTLAFALISFYNFASLNMNTKVYTDISQINSFGDVRNYTLDGINKAVMQTRDLNVLSKDTSATIESRRGTNFVLKVENVGNQSSEIEIPITGFKEYVAKDDNGYLETKRSTANQKLVLVVPSKYKGTVKIYYKEPIVWRISEIISLLTILFVIYSLCIETNIKELLKNKSNKLENNKTRFF